MNCNGLHCGGCGSGGGKGPRLAALVVVVAVAVIAANGKAIGRGAAEVGHVLVLVAVAGAVTALATSVLIVALMGLSRRRRGAQRVVTGARESAARIDYAATRVVTGAAPRELPAPRADIPAEVRIRPARKRAGR